MRRPAAFFVLAVFLAVAFVASSQAQVPYQALHLTWNPIDWDSGYQDFNNLGQAAWMSWFWPVGYPEVQGMQVDFYDGTEVTTISSIYGEGWCYSTST